MNGMTHPVIERARELLRQSDEKERQHAEWRASREGEPDALEAWQSLMPAPEPQAAQQAIERVAYKPKRFGYITREKDVSK